LRKCSTQTPRTTGNEPNHRFSAVHRSIIADGRAHLPMNRMICSATARGASSGI
jgi:hypothetical protein